MSTTLTVDFFMSLDGYGIGDGWPGYWGKEGPEIVATGSKPSRRTRCWSSARPPFAGSRSS